MQAINKIHVNSATKLSLNDRFTIIQTVRPKSPGPGQIQGRSRSRSRSVPRSINQMQERTSMRNRKLLEQLDQKHKMRAALKIKRKSLRANLPARQRLANQARNRVTLRKGLTTLRQGGRIARGNGRLKRTKFANIATMQADLIGQATLRKRSNSITNLAGRLGNRREISGVAPARRRLNRSNLTTLKLSNSRQSLLARSTSQTNVGGRSTSRKRQPSMTRENAVQRQPRRSRSLGRNRINVVNVQNSRSTVNRSNSRGRAMNARGNSVNARLGINRTRPTAQGGGGVTRGRILKRRSSNAVGRQNMRQTAIVGAKLRLGRSRSRLAPAANKRNRSLSRGRLVNRQGKNTNISKQNRLGQNQQSGSGMRRGRARSRSRGRAGRQPANAAPTKTREELDKELDQYMVNTKSANSFDGIL